MYVLCLISIGLMLLIPLISTITLRTTYSKCLNKESSNKLTGYDVARKILDNNELNSLYIIETGGTMTDNYDSNRKTVRLSPDVFHGSSIAAVAIAAHECGHAIQDKESYSWFRARHSIFPVVSLGERASYIVLILGLVLGVINLVYLAVALMAFGLLFEIVTLPVELDASKRALAMLDEYGIVTDEDRPYAAKMLKAAAFTYIAAILTTLAQMLYYISRYSGRRR